MKKYVIVATKGRADECRELLSLLAGQSAPLDAVYVVGAEPPDVEGLQAHPLASRTRLTVCLSPAQGLTRQRNHGVERLLADIDTDAPGDQDWFVVFFDDDYRPAADWAACCEQVFAENREIVALSGAHALGRCHPDASGYDGPWTPTPTTLNNGYYSLLLNVEWTPRDWDGPFRSVWKSNFRRPTPSA